MACASTRTSAFTTKSSSNSKRSAGARTWNAGATSCWSCATSSPSGTPTNTPRPAPSSSKMLEHELKALCKKLKPVLGRRADALWLAYISAETPQSRREAEMMIQMFAARLLERRIDEQNILLPPPQRQEADGEFVLGTVVYGNRPLYPLYLTRENFIKHVGIFSITGGGKTNVAYLLLLGLLDKDVPFLVVDWKRSYRALRTLRIPKVSDLRIFTVGRKSA